MLVKGARLCGFYFVYKCANKTKQKRRNILGVKREDDKKKAFKLIVDRDLNLFESWGVVRWILLQRYKKEKSKNVFFFVLLFRALITFRPS